MFLLHSIEIKRICCKSSPQNGMEKKKTPITGSCCLRIEILLIENSFTQTIFSLLTLSVFLFNIDIGQTFLCIIFCDLLSANFNLILTKNYTEMPGSTSTFIWKPAREDPGKNAKSVFIRLFGGHRTRICYLYLFYDDGIIIDHWFRRTRVTTMSVAQTLRSVQGANA